ncbi:hypothetical protein [Flavobacterium sp. K5-23]|uniref:hypothetical protein n=1 Tax=Flavobacterium sp. K5-23 TaxID=2746225 RepID=UPI00200CD249|nr:hypothetical protein [Flavobacterium sp. K5-23]UQD56854.1 hypothetical protein FLAK523_10800 [Flavobacterium sp. K5-23]
MNLKIASALIVVSILGMLSIILPVFILDDLKPYESPLFPLIRTGIEGISKYSLLFLFISGFSVKLFSNVPFWIIGLMSMFLFPLATFCEMIADSSSHNMFPFEFIFYGLFTIPAIIGAYASHLIKKFVITKM